jgi:hypothetical protein
VTKPKLKTPQSGRTQACWMTDRPCAACHGMMASDGFVRWCLNPNCPVPSEAE